MQVELLYQFLEKNYSLDRADLSPTTELFTSGLLDSMSMLNLIDFLEKESGKNFETSDLILDNLNTIEKIMEKLIN